jgi:hypothetical protein
MKWAKGIKPLNTFHRTIKFFQFCILCRLTKQAGGKITKRQILDRRYVTSNKHQCHFGFALALQVVVFLLMSGQMKLVEMKSDPDANAKVNADVELEPNPDT